MSIECCFRHFRLILLIKRVVDETNEIDRGGIVYFDVSSVCED